MKLKSFIVRYAGGYTTRIDAPSKAKALALAEEKRPEGMGKVIKITAMTPDWMTRL